MTISDILDNEELRQTEFPVTRQKIFLAHAAVCPLPRRVGDAMRRFVEDGTRDEQELGQSRQIIRHARRLAAALLEVQPEEIALVGPTSLGLSFVAASFPLQPGDNVVIYPDDYPSNVYPWAALARKGVEVRPLEVRQSGRIDIETIATKVDDKTRLVALASCHFLSGYRLNLEELASFLRERNIAFCVDAIQTAGAFPTPARQSDFLAADAHKWMLGPCAAGILRVAREWQDRLPPVVYGWHNVRCPNFVAQEQLVHPPDARRYEPGSANLVGLVGLTAALELLLEIGIDEIARELIRKRAWLIPALQEKGYSVLHADVPAANASGILALDRDKTDFPALHAKLSEANIITSLRTDRQGKHYLRLSPHFYNTDAELRRLLKHLP